MLPPLSRIVVTRPRLSNFAVVPRVVVTLRVLPLLSRSTTVPLARVVRVNTFFAPFDLPLPESLLSPAFTVLPGWSVGLVDEPRPGRTFRAGFELSDASAGALDRPGLFVSGLFAELPVGLPVAFPAELPIEVPPRAGLPFHGLFRTGFSVEGAAWSPAFAGDAGCAGVVAEEPRPGCVLREGGGVGSLESAEDPERPGLLFPLPCGAGFDVPSSFPLPGRFEAPDRVGAFADEPRELPDPDFASLLRPGGRESCPPDARCLSGVFCAEC